MTKKIHISTIESLSSGKLLMPEIGLCRNLGFDRLKEGLNNKELLHIWEFMQYIRLSEETLKEIKNTQKYKEKDASFKGPLHLSIGQEAACVGQAYALDANDYSFGNHRSHGELLARSLIAIEKMSDKELETVMTSYFDGYIFKTIEPFLKDLSWVNKARIFVLYGFFAEIFGKNTGFQKGIAGSMHVFFPPFGIFPSNAIVGASAPIAAGASLYMKNNNSKTISVANLGDGATGCGIVNEAMNFSSMKQFDTLWEAKGGLPILFSFFNNGYGMGGQTVGETMAYDKLVRIGAGINEKALLAERINGMDPLAVYYWTKNKRNELIKGNGPAMLDMVLYRFEGHSQSDKEDCRTGEEVEEWRKIDPITVFKQLLLNEKIAKDCDFISLSNEIENNIDFALSLVLNDKISPNATFVRETNTSSSLMELLETDEPICRTNAITYKEAITEAISEAFKRENMLISYGVNVRDWSADSSVYSQINKILGYDKLFNSPVSEACMVSAAIGYAMCGGKVIVDLMFSGFIGRSGDELFNQLAKWQELSGNYFKLPVIIRVLTSKNYGAQHSQDWASLVSHVPGLVVLYPATPYDAKGLFNAALNCGSPVVFFESKELYDKKEVFKKLPKNYYECPIGVPEIRSFGNDFTIITIGPSLYQAFEATKILEQKGYKVDIFDARTLVPFDFTMVIKSIEKTGRVLIVGNENERSSILAEFSHQINLRAFKFLKQAPIIIGAANKITPSYENLGEYFPTKEMIVNAVLESLIKN